MILLSLVSPSLAATLTVGSGGYSDISTAVSAALDGDTIAIGAGTWEECVDLAGKDLSLVGAGADDTVLLGDGTCDSALALSVGEEAVIEDLSVTNPDGRGIWIEGGTVTLRRVSVYDSGGLTSEGGGALITDATVTLEDCTFQDNHSGQGGHLALNAAAVEILGGTFGGGEANDFGGAIWATAPAGASGTLYLEGVVFSENQADYGGALAQIYRTTLESVGVSWLGNVATDGSGGAVVVAQSSASIDGDLFQDNWNTFDSMGTVSLSQGHGGALYVTGGDALRVTGATFEGNTAGTFGGAVSAEGLDSLEVTDCVFTSNTASYYGGALLVGDEVVTTVSGSTFAENSADDGGALGIYPRGTLTLSQSTFQDNTASEVGGALWLLTVDEVLVERSTFDRNQSGEEGGAIWSSHTTLEVTDSALTDNAATLDGGAIYDDSGSITLTRTRLERNTSGGSGGAVALDWGDRDASTDTVLSAVRLADNTAAEDGGGLWAYERSGVTLDAVVAQGNSVSASDGGGGGIYIEDTTPLDLHGLTMCGNEAAYGGGLWLGNSSSTGSTQTLDNSLFVDNTATEEGGGAYLIYQMDLAFSNNTLVGNAAGLEGGGLKVRHSNADFSNSIFAWTGSGDALVGRGTLTETGTTLRYNNWYENTEDDVSGVISVSVGSDGNIAENPGFVAYSADGDCANDDLRLDSGSALIDAGDPSVLDADGSPSDLGAYGGPDPLAWDADGDGIAADDDCDDADAAVGVAGLEVYADADGDGYGAGDATVACAEEEGTATTTGDCDDGDPAISPGAVEVADGLDNDCDGETDESLEPDDSGGAGEDGSGGEGAGDDGGAGTEGAGDEGSASDDSGSSDSGGDGADGSGAEGSDAEDSAMEVDDPDGKGCTGCASGHRPVAPLLMGALVLLVSRRSHAVRSAPPPLPPGSPPSSSARSPA